MDHVLLALILLVTAAISLFAAGHALLSKRDSRAALGWMSFSLTLPLLGPFLYWCMGVNRISRRARRWSTSGRRISGHEIHPFDEHEVESVELPESIRYLRNLRVLGDRIVRTPLRQGNRIQALVDGQEAYPAMLAAIGRARRSINLSSYIFDADGVGAEFVTQLKLAAGRGVEVRTIVDALGEKYSRAKARRALAGSPVRFRLYLPLRHGFSINLRNHRKLLIIDGSEAFTGGMNIRSNHLPCLPCQPAATHDMHFHVAGPVVHDLQRAFLEDWYFVTGERLDDPLFFPEIGHRGTGVARCISDGPDREFRKLEQIIMGALACAEKSVQIMTPYFVPDRPMVSALITTAMRGVDVVIVLPATSNLPFVHWATRALLGELIANGVRVYYQRPPFAHTKLFLLDGVWSLIGSANMDARSLRLNFELNLTVFDLDLAERIKAHFARALDGAQEVTLAELKSRSLPVKLRDNFARLFSPYL